MSKLLKTLAQYMIEREKEETYFMVFNTVYNDIYALNNEPENKLEKYTFGYLNKEYVNNEAREEFIDYPNLSYAGAATFVADAGESSIQLFI